MVKRLAEKNGGSIRAESKEGQGSAFYVELPAA
jgi:signal transduction histidine kinase